MCFFATNSILARFALRGQEIDAASFTLVRISAGAVMLALLVAIREKGLRAVRANGAMRAGVALFGYAILFSFAYLSLNAGTGALIQFAAVQITMLSLGIARGERPPISEWIGLVLAFGGLVYLVLPGLAAPSPVGAVLMAGAGAAWGYYSVAARGVRFPTAATAGNFIRATPMAAATLLLFWAIGHLHASRTGIALAATSGAITSGLGYALWYHVLKTLHTTRAAIVQLTVPVLVALAGVFFLSEKLTWRLAVASVTILGGVALAVLGRSAAKSPFATQRP